ncbi:MAG: hypothetical protein AB7I30_19530, partial [Isosphaeraceae bacterium]
PGSYKVAATWPAHPNRATDAPYTVLDGTTPLTTSLINQKLAPNDFNDAATNWKNLGTFTVSGGVLRVQLTNAANGYVGADAIRIERVSRPLYLNFEAVNISSADLVRWAGTDWGTMTKVLDPKGDGITSYAFLPNRADRETIITSLMSHLQADLNPFGITVHRHTGLAVEGAGATTIFLGGNTAADETPYGGWAEHIACDIDFYNDNLTDVAFVGDENWGSAADTALALADVVLHEAGHTFGLYHVNTLQDGTLYHESMGLRYSTSDQRRWLADTSFMDRAFNEYSNHGGGRGPQNAFQTMTRNFSSPGLANPGPEPRFPSGGLHESGFQPPHSHDFSHVDRQAFDQHSSGMRANPGRSTDRIGRSLNPAAVDLVIFPALERETGTIDQGFTTWFDRAKKPAFRSAAVRLG